jgi:hypothetical protein
MYKTNKCEKNVLTNETGDFKIKISQMSKTGEIRCRKTTGSHRDSQLHSAITDVFISRVH